jgi:hypothetical protein
LGALGNLGSDGHLWTVQQDGSEVIITPHVSSFRSASSLAISACGPFTNVTTGARGDNPGQQKHKPVLKVNDTQLDPDKEGPDPFCVGQKLVFSLEFAPPLGAGTVSEEKHEWWLPANYVNAKEEYNLFYDEFDLIMCHPFLQLFSRYRGMSEDVDPPCTRYRMENWPLKQMETGAWWVSDGLKLVSCYADITFSNGNKASLTERGRFRVVKPHITRIEPQPPFGGAIDFSETPPYPPMLALIAGPMEFKVFISRTYPGAFGMTQLVNYYTETGMPLPPYYQWHSTSGSFWEDGSTEYYDGLTQVTLEPGSWPSDDEYHMSSAILDPPGGYLIMQYGTYQGYWKDYVRFIPSGAGSIAITLGRIEWNWISWADHTGVWRVTVDSVLPPQRFNDDAFPEWTRVKSGL